jgi:uncharacterized membrane protein YhaH (DUF805 family)
MAYLTPWKKYATFSGRAGRAEFWTFWLVNVVIGGVLWGIGLGTASTDATTGLSTGMSTPILVVYVLFGLAILLPSLAVSVRRLHDSGRSGGWYFISFVPCIGPFWLLVLMALAGTPGANQYGEDPRTAPPVPVA